MDLSRFTELLSKNIFWIFLLAALAVIYLVPIRISSNISISGKIFPAKQWVLFAGTNGQIMNTQIDLVAGVSHVYQSREFSRGDDVRFEIHPEILKKSLIQKGDTIGKIFSNQTHMLLNEMRKELEVKKALLVSYQSGEKAEFIELARRRLQYAEIDAEKQKKEFARQRELFGQEVITEQDFEDQERLLQLAEAEVEIKKAELESANSGEKPETKKMVQAEIDKIKAQISDLEEKLDLQTIISPITGIFQNSYAADTLMIIQSMDDLIIKMPVGLSDRNRVYIGQNVTSTVLGQKQAFQSEVVQISNHISVTGGKQTFIVTAAIREHQEELLPGVVFKGEMDANKILLRDYIMSWFGFFNKWM